MIPATGQIPLEEEESRAREERLHTLFETSPDPIYLKDGEGRWLEANEAGLQVFRLSKADYRGRTDLELSEFDDFFREAFIACFESDQRAWAAGRASQQVEVVPQPDGGSRIFDVIKVPLFYPDGRRKSLIILGREVTLRYKAEQERDRLLLQEQEARAVAEEARRRSEFLATASRRLAGSLDYEATLSTVAWLAVPFLGEWCAVDLVGEEGRIHRAAVAAAPSWTEHARQLEDCTPDSQAARGIAEVIRTGNPVVFAPLPGEEALPSLCDHGGAHLPAVQAMGLRSALSVPLLARGRTMGALTLASARRDRYRDEDVALAMDLAWRAALAMDNARLYSESQEAIRARDEFLSVASHELRTPLTALMLSVQRLLRRASVGSELPRTTLVSMLEGTQRQGRRLSQLLDRLLDVSRLQARRVQLELEEMDLAEMARDVASLFEEELRRTDTPLTLRAEAPVLGRWDRSRLEQVVTNLLNNAIKYGAEAPIEVEIGAEGEMAVLSVKDRGIGIAPERLPFIFGRFERAVSTRHYGGLGLGLYIVRQLVELHGGTVHVESTPGQGTTFTVRLPRSGPLRGSVSSRSALSS